MPEQVIQRHEAVQHINTGVACIVEFVEANRTKGTGGKLRKLMNWARLTKEVSTDGIVGQYESRDTWERQKTTIDKEIIMMYDPDNTMMHPIPVHYWLLCSLNGKRIV